MENFRRLFREIGQSSSRTIQTLPTGSAPAEQACSPVPILKRDVYPPDAFIGRLPPELIRLTATHLDEPSAAAFYLSSNWIRLLIGNRHLKNYLESNRRRNARREKMWVLENAFPSHWYCSWCDKWHPCEQDDGPRTFGIMESKRECAESNGFLHHDNAYVLAYHHVRLAMDQYLWGAGHGIPLSYFTYNRSTPIKPRRVQGLSTLNIDAKIVEQRFLLHATWTLSHSNLEVHAARFTKQVFDHIPQIVVGHRSDRAGHTGLFYKLDRLLTLDRESGIQLCSTCATDYTLSLHTSSRHDPTSADKSKTIKETDIKIEIWRDLGEGRDPFDRVWRAHTDIGNCKESFGSDIVRLATLQPGSIRALYEGIDEEELADSYRSSFDSIEYHWPGREMGRMVWDPEAAGFVRYEYDDEVRSDS